MTHAVNHRPFGQYTSPGTIRDSQANTELSPVATTGNASNQVNQALSVATNLPPSSPAASLFPGGSASTAAGSNPGETKAPGNNKNWTEGGSTGCGCGAKGCGGNKGSQSQGTQSTQSQDTAQRPQDSVSKQDSPGSGALPPAPPPSIFNN